jgi:hypothetical protein
VKCYCVPFVRKYIIINNLNVKKSNLKILMLCVVIHGLIIKMKVKIIYGKGRKLRESAEDCVVRSFIPFTLHQILLGYSYQGGWDGRGM